ncbi:repressor LexA [Candidatus Beckwithbacteria bacterium RBG_13_42_9]|uniref:LexA repressor n=1 Tax=Candidatus Beckwithbacteria bacterium RBG_13_42_9 TaxID=1797457 RepID=A0A1F5E975_9BACT|nr:MAG: repressor LexA [Candidatus Beckwithbacteria bacterium RBG_13_42_9]
MPTITLYRRQREIVEYLAQYLQKHGYAPTLREIADALGLSSLATVHEHISRLIEKGVLTKGPAKGSVRDLRLVDKGLASLNRGVSLPVLGWIAAGQPIQPYEQYGVTLQVAPEMLTGKKKAYVLQVKGDSMIGEGILDGDYVVVEEETSVKDGDIIVAILENGLATLKKFFREATRIRLEPANTSMTPIYATRIQVQGRVVGIIRRFQRN